jgi:hypothetical protein
MNPHARVPRALVLVLIGIAFVAGPAMAQKVTIDYAHDFDFTKVKTFLYVDTPETAVRDQLMAGRIVSAIKRELVEAGLTEAAEDGPAPDLVVTYHVTTQENQTMVTTGMGMGTAGMGRRGRGAGWGGWGGGATMGTATTRTHTSVEGTLIIDAFDPGDEQLVWRGSGAATVKGKPENQTKQIDNVVKKLGKRWDKILHGKGK